MSQRKFVNRTRELEFLEGFYRRGEPAMLVVSGRRRVGKTEVLIRFLAGKPGIYFLASEEGDPQNILAFAHQAAVVLGDPNFERIRFGSWQDLFSAFISHAGFLRLSASGTIIIVMDEFPYLISHNPAIPSIFQGIWDRILRDVPVLLILSGSSISTMESAVLGYQSPLYGRRSGQWQVEPLSFPHIREFLPGYSVEEAVKAWCVLGGIPGYLQKFSPGLSFWENVRQNVLDKGAYLYSEADLLMNYEFREPSNYMVIFRAIAKGCTTLGDICNETGLDKGMVSKYLSVLVRLHILKEEIPLTASPKFRKRHYRITDPYLNFWFRMVAPNRIDIEAGRSDAVLHRVREEFPAYCGPMFEVLATDLVRAGDLLSGRQFSAIGRWWHRETGIDCIALNDATGEVVFCECKWQSLTQKEGAGALHRLEKNALEFRWRQPDRTEEYCLIAKKVAGKKFLRDKGYYVFDLDDFPGVGV